MAINIISANLNVYGNNGHFETDRSTWGFSDAPILKEITRSGEQKYAGLWSAKVRNLYGLEPLSQSISVPGRFPAPTGSVGKKFLIRARVFVDATSPIAADEEVISISQVDNAYLIWLDELSVTSTVGDAKGSWATISAVCEIVQDYFLGYHVCQIEVSGTHILNGLIFVDEFEIFQVEVTDDPEPTCTIDLDEENTVVVNESAPGADDGSIEGAVTGGTGPFEWKLDGGAWQSSSLFTGLGSGPHTLYVREQGNPDCYDSHIFVINAGDTDFDFAVSITNESIAGAADGAAVITPSGSGGPFTYSKDGGATFQYSNSFSNLPAGIYAFVVKDTNGNSLLKYATVASGAVLFEKAWLSRNHIPFSVNAQSGYGSLTNYRIYCDTRVEDVPGSGVFVSKMTQELPPDSDGKAVFNLRPVFRDQLVAIAPSVPTSSIVKLTDRIRWYKNYVGHLSGTEVVPGELMASNPFIVLLGGVSKYDYPTIDYLTAYLQSNKKFLTWAPVIKDVTRQQEDYLNFFVYSPSITSLKLRIKVYYSDGTDETAIHSTVTCQYGELYQIPAGPSNTSVLTVDPEKTPVRYELSLLNQSDTPISEVRTYNIDRVTHPRTKYLMFLNSLGSYEVHRFVGTTTSEEEYTREVIQKFLPDGYDAQDGEVEVNSVVGQRRFQLSSGFFRGKYADEWLDYMRDLLRTTRLFDVTSGSRRPLVITNSAITLKEDQNFRRFVRVEAREVYVNENYTPDMI